jgi:phosphatidylserine decarboxylase
MIKYYNRITKEYEIEKVAGENYLNWTYSSPAGMKFLELFIKKKLFSRVYGYSCDRPGSIKKIRPFIKDLDINMNESLEPESNFKNFNEFFIRKLKPEARPINMNTDSLISLGDGRILAYENIDLNKIVQVKGFTYSLKELTGENTVSNKYKDGTCLILRLCPTDYHRFHFVDNGMCEKSNKIDGDYYSVNPTALKKIPKLYCRNKREWSIFHSENFGDILFVEVGATCVGTIIQTYTPQKRIQKGAEKGYFKFGGSTIIMFLEKDKVIIDEGIIQQTNMGFETKVKMGEKIGNKK